MRELSSHKVNGLNEALTIAVLDPPGQGGASHQYVIKDVRAALAKWFSPPESTIVFEVAQGTGSHANRHLDAIAMELWPSRGLTLHGIEIKVNLYDWRREKANPEKAEEVARFCDMFWIAAPEDLIPIEELPTAWGLFVIGADGVARIQKQAARTPAQPLCREFLAAVLRAASRPIDRDTLQSMLAKERIELQKTFDAKVEHEAKRVATNNSSDAENWRTLVGLVSGSPERFYRDSELLAAVKVVYEAGVASSWKGLRSAFKALNECRTAIGVALGELSISEVDDDKPRRKRKTA